MKQYSLIDNRGDVKFHIGIFESPEALIEFADKYVDKTGGKCNLIVAEYDETIDIVKKIGDIIYKID